MILDAAAEMVEREGIWQITDNFQINGNLGILDADYTSVTGDQARGLTNNGAGCPAGLDPTNDSLIITCALGLDHIRNWYFWPRDPRRICTADGRRMDWPLDDDDVGQSRIDLVGVRHHHLGDFTAADSGERAADAADGVADLGEAAAELAAERTATGVLFPLELAKSLREWVLTSTCWTPRSSIQRRNLRRGTSSSCTGAHIQE